MKNRIISYLLIAFVTAGCATTGSRNEISDVVSSEKNLDSPGVLLISTGRKNSGSLIANPFISYSVYRLRNEDEVKKVAFLPAEAGLFNQLGKGKYGFIHYRQLPEGDYVLVGQKGRGNGLDSPFGVLAILPAASIKYDTNGNKVDVTYEFRIEKGVVNYLGEILIASGDISFESVEVTNQYARDSSYLFKKQPSLSSLRVVTTDVRKKE